MVWELETPFHVIRAAVLARALDHIVQAPNAPVLRLMLSDKAFSKMEERTVSGSDVLPSAEQGPAADRHYAHVEVRRDQAGVRQEVRLSKLEVEPFQP